MKRWLKQLWCALHDHGGIEVLSLTTGRCKRCGKRVNIDCWFN